MSGSVALAYSGGLDTNWCVAHLTHEKGMDVTAICVDVSGLSTDEQQKMEETVLGLGAREMIFIDARNAFYDQVLRHLIRGNVLRGNLYPLCVGAERSLQASLVAIEAVRIGASAVAHGCTAAGNDQVRFEIALRAQAPNLEILAPVRDGAVSRDDETALLAKHGLIVPPRTTSYSVNAGLWGVTIGGVETLSSEQGLPEDAWVRTAGAFNNTPTIEQLTLDFEHGEPTALNGNSLDPVTLIQEVDNLAASFGIGRGIHLGNTILGAKGRVAFEAPAATVLLKAHQELEKLVLTDSQLRTKALLSETYGQLIHQGRFLEPDARDIEAYFTSNQQRVTGSVSLTLRPSSVFVEGVTSDFSLMAATRSSYGEQAVDWSTDDARGLSVLNGLEILLHQRAGSNHQ